MPGARIGRLCWERITMHPILYNRYKQLFRQYPPPGNEILEIGATANVDTTLLTLFKDISEAYHCIGINIKVKPVDHLPYTLIECNGNDMSIFEDETFDAVCCNAVLEHDRLFWKTIAEIRRVLKPGGLFYVGVPGFSRRNTLIQRALRGTMRFARAYSIPFLYRLGEWGLLGRLASTPTYMFHAAPNDFYRFSEEAVKEVFLEGFEVLHLECMLQPVRIIGVGSKLGGEKR